MPAGSRPDPPAHVMRIAIIGLIGGVNWANVFWVKNGGGVTPGQAVLDSFTDLFALAYDGRFKFSRFNTCTMQRAHALYYDAGGPVIDSDRTQVHAGTGGASSLTANVACCIGWKISAHYRGGHPRTYLPGPPAGVDATVNTFDGTYIANVAAAANGFIGDVNALAVGGITSVQLGTVSFVRNKLWRSPPVFQPYVVGGASCDSRIDSQRRRLGRDR